MLEIIVWLIVPIQQYTHTFTVEPIVETPQVVQVERLEVKTIDDMVRDKFVDEFETAHRIMNCESKEDPNAYNKSGASGLFQIIQKWHKDKIAGRDIFNPEINIDVAYQIYLDSGWSAWKSSKKCWSKKESK